MNVNKQLVDKLVIKSFIEKLDNEKLVFLYERLNDGYQDDLYEALDYLSKNSDMDKILVQSKDSNVLFNVLYALDSAVDKEIIRRKIVITI